jgi:exodeoxyribonuclease VII large subunit
MRARIRECRAYIGGQRRALLDPAALVQRAMQRRDDLEMRLRMVARSRMKDGRVAIENCRQDLLLQSPLRRIHQRLALLPHLQTRLTHHVANRAALCRRSVHQASAALHALSPLAILARGYSITRRWPDMTLIRRASDVLQGDAVHVRLGAGELICEVRRVSAESPLKVDS